MRGRLLQFNFWVLGTSPHRTSGEFFIHPMSLAPSFERIRKYGGVAGVGLLVAMICLTGHSMFNSYDMNVLSLRDNEAIVPDTHQYRRDMPTFPLVYVADGILQCGGLLVADRCSANPTTSYSQYTTNEPFHISERHDHVLLYQEQYNLFVLPFSIVTIIVETDFTVPATFQIGITPTPLSTRIIMQTTYSPSISTTTASISLSQVRLATTTSSNPALPRRSYDFNPCQDGNPTHNFVSSSLEDVCRFIANVQQYFVSSRPAAVSAYLPCWPGYLVQAFVSILNLFQIVSYPRDPGLTCSIKAFSRAV
jgi:hypothetical protein